MALVRRAVPLGGYVRRYCIFREVPGQEPFEKKLTRRLNIIIRHPLGSTVIGGLLLAAIIGAVHMLSSGHDPRHAASHNGRRASPTSPSSPSSPLTIVSHLVNPAGVCNEGGAGWVFPVSPSHLPLPNLNGDEREIGEWVIRNNGITASGNNVEVTLQATPGRTVEIRQLIVRVVKRYPPLRGTYAVLTQGCGSIVPYYYKANLDSRIPLLSEVAGYRNGIYIKPERFPQGVSNGAPEVWMIQATTSKCTCSWVGELEWVSEGRQGRLTITHDGKPFEAAATASAVSVYAEFGGAEHWMPDTTRG